VWDIFLKGKDEEKAESRGFSLQKQKKKMEGKEEEDIRRDFGSLFVLSP